MQKNGIWIGFLVLIAVISAWFIVKGGTQLLHYYQLSASAPATIESWEVEQLGSNRYVVKGKFSFAHGKGESTVGGNFPNAWAAGRAKERFEAMEWTVWYNSKDPSKATLEKVFPWKSTISAVILAALLLYFFCLGLYVRAKK